jgi:hypothetical protein
MFLVSMPSQRGLCIEASVAPLLGALERPYIEMFLANVDVQCVTLSETLATVLAAKSVRAVVYSLVTLQPRASRKRLSTAVPLAHMFSFECMGTLDMLFEMFVLDIVLVAIRIWAFEWARIGM